MFNFILCFCVKRSVPYVYVYHAALFVTKSFRSDCSFWAMHSHAAHGHFRLVVAVVAVHPVDSALRLLVRWRFVRGSSHVRWMFRDWIGFLPVWITLRLLCGIDWAVSLSYFASGYWLSSVSFLVCFRVLIEQCLFLSLLPGIDSAVSVS